MQMPNFIKTKFAEARQKMLAPAPRWHHTLLIMSVGLVSVAGSFFLAGKLVELRFGLVTDQIHQVWFRNDEQGRLISEGIVFDREWSKRVWLAEQKLAAAEKRIAELEKRQAQVGGVQTTFIPQGAPFPPGASESQNPNRQTQPQ